jgi:hypothetical protein
MTSFYLVDTVEKQEKHGRIVIHRTEGEQTASGNFSDVTAATKFLRVFFAFDGSSCEIKLQERQEMAKYGIQDW